MFSAGSLEQEAIIIMCEVKPLYSDLLETQVGLAYWSRQPSGYFSPTLNRVSVRREKIIHTLESRRLSQRLCTGLSYSVVSCLSSYIYVSLRHLAPCYDGQSRDLEAWVPDEGENDDPKGERVNR